MGISKNSATDSSARELLEMAYTDLMAWVHAPCIKRVSVGIESR